ncbi:ABC transporter permease, partial [Klebsiella pneumoniae]
GIEKKLADWPVDLPGAALLSLLLMAVALFAWWLTVGIEKKLADWPVDLPGAALLSLLLMAVALFAWW